MKHIYKIIILVLIYLIIKLKPILTKKSLPIGTYTSGNNDIYGIPKIIFRTWHTHEVSKKMFDNAHTTWIKQNTGYKMFWYNKQDCGSFLKKIDPELYRVWKKIKPLAFKSDIWRLGVLYQYGGIYADATSKPFAGMDKLIRDCYKNNKTIRHKLISAKEPWEKGIHNGFIIATPRHPFIKKYIDDIIYNIQHNKTTSVRPILGICGPSQYYKTISSVLKNIKIGMNKTMYKGEKVSFYMIQLRRSIYFGDILHRDNLYLIKKYDIIDSLIFKKLLNLKNDYLFLSLTNSIY